MGSIRLDRVGKVFPGNTVAVREVDLSVEDGEFVVFVGPSGCGKSTLLRMIAGLETITSGEIRINDKVVNSIAPRDRDIAMVFQSYALYPQMTVRQNIAFALELRRFSRQEIAERVAEAARILDLTELLDRKPGQLSGGQRQRVAMGRAIVRHPQAFLLDEPLSNLDAKLRVQLRAELGRLHARLGVTTIHVTHDQVEAMTLGSRVAVFSRGMLQQYDTPHALYHAPANVFVAGFIGSPAMNLLEATVAEAGAAPAVTVGGVRIGLGAQPRAGRLAAGDKVILGVRPEHLLVRPQSAEAQDALPARVELVEHLEPESYVAVTPSVPAVVRASDDFTRGTADADRTSAARMITLRVSASRLPARGEPIQVAVEPGRAHLFDMTGAAL